VKKISYGIIMLGTIKCTMNLKLQQIRLSDFHIQTSNAIGFLMPFINNLASVSDLKITFNELVVLESFISSNLLW